MKEELRGQWGSHRTQSDFSILFLCGQCPFEIELASMGPLLPRDQPPGSRPRGEYPGGGKSQMVVIETVSIL